jgi:hypothetical protein
MRRHLDPRQLEALAHDEDGPSRTPIELIQDGLRKLFGLFVIAVVMVFSLALALSELPGVTP